jgi:hypothetical protein
MPLQDTYTDRQPLAVEGQKFDGEEYNAVTRLVEDAGGYGFGKPVMRGTRQDSALKLTVAGAAGFLGVSVRDVTIRPSAAGNGDRYPKGANSTILTGGSIAVRVSGAVNPGQAARFDVAGDRFTAAAVAGNVVALPAGWEFDTAAADGGIAKLVKR